MFPSPMKMLSARAVDPATSEKPMAMANFRHLRTLAIHVAVG